MQLARRWQSSAKRRLEEKRLFSPVLKGCRAGGADPTANGGPPVRRVGKQSPRLRYGAAEDAAAFARPRTSRVAAAGLCTAGLRMPTRGSPDALPPTARPHGWARPGLPLRTPPQTFCGTEQPLQLERRHERQTPQLQPSELPGLHGKGRTPTQEERGVPLLPHSPRFPPAGAKHRSAGSAARVPQRGGPAAARGAFHAHPGPPPAPRLGDGARSHAWRPTNVRYRGPTRGGRARPTPLQQRGAHPPPRHRAPLPPPPAPTRRPNARDRGNPRPPRAPGGGLTSNCQCAACSSCLAWSAAQPAASTNWLIITWCLSSSMAPARRRRRRPPSLPPALTAPPPSRSRRGSRQCLLGTDSRRPASPAGGRAGRGGRGGRAGGAGRWSPRPGFGPSARPPRELHLPACPALFAERRRASTRA